MDLNFGLLENYHGRNSQYVPPIEIGSFSVNSDGEFQNDNHQMKYLAMPEKTTGLHMDLNEGYSDYIRADEDSRIKHQRLLKWILSNEEAIRNHFKDNSSNSKVDFICSRGFLADVASTVYEKSNHWGVYATKFRSVIYLCSIKTQHEIQVRRDLGERGKRMTSWGYKFEQYMTSDSINSRPNTSVPVNQNEKYHVVLKAKLDNHRILMRAEVDAVDPEPFVKTGGDPSSEIRYVELKTSKIITERGKWSFRRYKLLNWYLQSYFGGVSQVLCGFRDDDGIVRKLESYDVKDMPNMANGLWNPTSCVNFCSRFLDSVKNCVVKDDPSVVYKILWKPGSNITYEELTSEDPLLPDWYIEEVKVI